MAQTSRFITPLFTYLFPNISADTLETVHMVIRKLAHFTEYGMLSYLAIRAFVRTDLQFVRQYAITLAIIVVACVASMDEINQSFEPSRTSSIADVLLDIAGGATVAVLFRLLKLPKRNDD